MLDAFKMIQIIIRNTLTLSLQSPFIYIIR